jgi:hypothetical protein
MFNLPISIVRIILFTPERIYSFSIIENSIVEFPTFIFELFLISFLLPISNLLNFFIKNYYHIPFVLISLPEDSR